MKEAKRPNSRRNLDIAIDRLCASTGDEPGRVKRLLATAIVGQMLPDGAAKGGNALKIRFGKDATRFSRDLDTARASSLDDYIARLEDALAIGWSGFTGIVVPREPASPKGVPPAYVMHPFEMVSSPEAAAMMRALGFPEPEPVPCMRLEHQIAQKLHAASSPGSERAHDLIDLQIAVSGGTADYAEVRAVCVRLFAYRQEQKWPPTIMKGEDWDSLYAAQADGLDVLPTADDAVAWANGLIERIDSSR